MKSYLFNSQLLSKADGSMLLVVPEECRNNPRVWNYLDQLTGDDGPIREVKVFDLKQSMQNGGGPACLRLRVALQERELAAVNPGVIMSAGLYDTLVAWVDRHYRDRLSETDLADPQLLLECRTALDELTQILNSIESLATMSDSLQLILEDTDGTQLETSCTRFAVVWQEVWVQQAGNGQLLIGVDVEDGDTEYTNLLLRPMATNLVSLQLEMEPIEEGDDHEHGPDCGCDHTH